MGENKTISSSLNASVSDINYDYPLNITNNYSINSSDNHNHDHDHNPPSSSDEISQFLRQILVRSALPLPPSSSIAPTHQSPYAETRCFSYPPSDAVLNPEISAVDFPHSGAFFSGNPPGHHVSSSSLGVSGNETDEYECESEEEIEAVVDETPVKPPASSRSSSKRSRAAEVHNLSEKRRRSRINEKMKALQKLIPNSNKTDKASMLDEAIEYLKQLQLQVQMLTVQNGLSLHPMCSPRGTLRPMQLTQTRLNIYENDNISPHVNMTNTLPVNQHNQFVHIPETKNPGSSSFGLESSIRSQFEPFTVLDSSEEPFKGAIQENMPPQDRLA